MIIELRGKAIDLTDAMRIHFEDTLGALQKYKMVQPGNNFHGDVHVYEKGRIKITIAATLANAKHLKVEVKGNDYYKLVRQAVKDLEKQIRKIQEKQNRKVSKGFKVEARNEIIEIEEAYA